MSLIRWWWLGVERESSGYCEVGFKIALGLLRDQIRGYEGGM